jgi:hypothetical protein
MTVERPPSRKRILLSRNEFVGNVRAGFCLAQGLRFPRRGPRPNLPPYESGLPLLGRTDRARLRHGSGPSCRLGGIRAGRLDVGRAAPVRAARAEGGPSFRAGRRDARLRGDLAVDAGRGRLLRHPGRLVRLRREGRGRPGVAGGRAGPAGVHDARLRPAAPRANQRTFRGRRHGIVPLPDLWARRTSRARNPLRSEVVPEMRHRDDAGLLKGDRIMPRRDGTGPTGRGTGTGRGRGFCGGAAGPGLTAPGAGLGGRRRGWRGGLGTPQPAAGPATDEDALRMRIDALKEELACLERGVRALKGDVGKA